MKRQFTRCVTLMLLLTMLLPVFSGCAQFHPHSFGQWETVKEPTCTETGLRVGICSCGKEIQEEMEPLGHGNGTWVTVLEPTELVPGSKELRCERCDALLQTEIIPTTEPSLNMYPSKDQECTINILTQREGDYGYFNDAADLWFFQYMEYWFAQQGYTVHIEVRQSNDIDQTKTLSLATDTLPDIFWGVELTNEEVVRYAIEEGMILEWTRYINESLMPNMARLFAEQPEAKILSTAPNGGIYGIPYVAPAQIDSGCFGEYQRLYFRQSWLDKAGVQNPTTTDELLSVLRAFKTKITDVSAIGDVPLVSPDGFLEKYLWSCMGFYGGDPGRFGNNLSIKYEELVLPAYTPSYREFVTIMKTMYDEGMISKNFFYYEGIVAGNYIIGNRCGAFCTSNFAYVGDRFSDIVCANPIPMEDITSIEDIHVSRPNTVGSNYIWARRSYDEPRILAMLIDFIYSEEGAWLYYYGPKQGEDPLGLVDGWYFDENGNVTTAKVADGTCISMSEYAYKYLCPNDYVGLRPVVYATGHEGVTELTDSVTGEKYTVANNRTLSRDKNDDYWRLITMEKWSQRVTSVRLPSVYLNADKMTEFMDRHKAIDTWINTETAKFITGVRPLSEIDAFWKELEALGVENYLALAKEGYADWMRATFQ